LHGTPEKNIPVISLVYVSFDVLWVQVWDAGLFFQKVPWPGAYEMLS